MKRVCVIFFLLLAAGAFAAEVIPPAPKQYFNDYAHVVSSATATRLNQTLEDFERQTSDQILVAIFPKMQSDSSVEDYTVRVARAWKVGQKEHDNGAVLFVFVQDHKIYLQVGYGLEGALPDALAKRIIDDEISPRFHNGNFDAGLSAGVAAILAATKGEYKGTGRTAAENHHGSTWSGFAPFLIFAVIFIVLIATSRRRGRGYSSRSGWWIGGGGFGGGFGGGGGFSGGGGGGFSGGGGSFGGGGAGGSW
ncbi:MAG TPA: TPM domain-containing protein [Verrucomicrobiae bacterium]|nr:TPM domain-containing protein [Verrucomicrobiae bacterium]